MIFRLGSELTNPRIEPIGEVYLVFTLVYVILPPPTQSSKEYTPFHAKLPTRDPIALNLASVGGRWRQSTQQDLLYCSNFQKTFLFRPKHIQRYRQVSCGWVRNIRLWCLREMAGTLPTWSKHKSPAFKFDQSSISSHAHIIRIFNYGYTYALKCNFTLILAKGGVLWYNYCINERLFDRLFCYITIFSLHLTLV